ncbi:MAG TPA: competence protein [Tissierellia bacterium]|nr:competence protein [Tissierellia bacterium]
MLYFSKKEQLILTSIVVVILFMSIFNFLRKDKEGTAGDITIEDYFSELDQTEEAESEEADEIMVHISGQVYNPGVVVLKPGARLIDAVNLAGGLKKEADLDKINLSKKLSDEEKIYIPKIGEEYIDVYESEGSNSSTGKIDINTCSKEELMSLPGIGEVLADRIIEYREKSRFKSIEEIMNVSGIGKGRFEDIKDLIIVR